MCAKSLHGGRTLAERMQLMCENVSHRQGIVLTNSCFLQEGALVNHYYVVLCFVVSRQHEKRRPPRHMMLSLFIGSGHLIPTDSQVLIPNIQYTPAKLSGSSFSSYSPITTSISKKRYTPTKFALSFFEKLPHCNSETAS